MKAINDLGEELCEHCELTDYGCKPATSVMSSCEGSRCDDAYENYICESEQNEYKKNTLIRQYKMNKNSQTGCGIKCPVCGISVIKKSYQQKFCSTKCKDDYHNFMRSKTDNNWDRFIQQQHKKDIDNITKNMNIEVAVNDENNKQTETYKELMVTLTKKQTKKETKMSNVLIEVVESIKEAKVIVALTGVPKDNIKFNFDTEENIIYITTSTKGADIDEDVKKIFDLDTDIKQIIDKKFDVKKSNPVVKDGILIITVPTSEERIGSIEVK